MKILCFIDSLGSGGAQRQLVTLAIGLKKRGHQIRFLVYHQEDHFLPLLQASDIACQVIPPCSLVQRAFLIRKIFQQGWQDVVLVFLEASSLYAELASIPGRHWGLVVGERSAAPNIYHGVRRLLRQFHRVADAVVCNSHTNRLMLASAFPFLRRKLCVVYNTVDLKHFKAFSDEVITAGGCSERIYRIVIAASYNAYKNMMNVAKALLLIKEQEEMLTVVIDWFGAEQLDKSPFEQVQRFIVENGLSELFRLHPVTRDIATEYYRADAVGLFSSFEGLPNVVCEGMACGKPILLSNVCDASNLVHDGKNGFLCDPNSPEDIAEKIICMVSLSEQERQRMGEESRRIADQLFADDVVINRYERILASATKHEWLPLDCNWPTEVPESALKTVERWA